MLTIAKTGAHSVAYYQSTVDENRGTDSYYSEDGKQPASVWLRGENVAEVSAFLGADNGALVSGKRLRIGSIRLSLRAVRGLEMLRERTVFQASI